MSRTLKVLVGLVCVLLALLGVRWMFAPLGMAKEIGMGLATLDALNVARGDLGGMFIAGAILGVIGLRSGDGRWLQAVALVIVCVAIGRAVGIYADGFAAMSLISIAVEVAMTAILLTAASRT